MSKANPNIWQTAADWPVTPAPLAPLGDAPAGAPGNTAKHAESLPVHPPIGMPLPEPSTMITTLETPTPVLSTWRIKMKCLITLVLAVGFAVPAAVAAKPAGSMAVNCDAGTATADGEAPNLHGSWDFLMVPHGTPSFGLMSIGFVGAEYGGSLMPARTAPVVLRKITLTGNKIQMAVASREGDVLFDGKLSAKGDFMCGTVTYHGGESFPMVAQKRPSTYQSPSSTQRAQPQAQRQQ